MSNTRLTTDHEEIKYWIQARGGRPAMVKSTIDEQNGGLLRVDFGEKDENLTEVSWEDFFKVFEDRRLGFLCDKEKESRFFKFVAREQ